MWDEDSFSSVVDGTDTISCIQGIAYCNRELEASITQCALTIRDDSWTLGVEFQIGEGTAVASPDIEKLSYQQGVIWAADHNSVYLQRVTKDVSLTHFPPITGLAVGSSELVDPNSGIVCVVRFEAGEYSSSDPITCLTVHWYTPVKDDC